MGGYDPAKDPRNDPKYKALIQRAGGINRDVAKAIEDDSRTGHVNWGNMKKKVDQAEKVRNLAYKLAGKDLRDPSVQGDLKELEKEAGGKRKAVRAVENANLSGGAKSKLLRNFLRGW